MANSIPVCLTVAGSDCSGGAGIQADLKTFAALGVFGASAITALTAQNTTGLKGVFAVDPGFVRLQIDAVFDDFPVAAAKTGMLGDSATITAVVEAFTLRPQCPLVVDPVLVARGGDPLLEPWAIGLLRDRLLPLATVIMPNRHEAVLLAGTGPITDVTSLRLAARTLFERTGRPILAKGGAILPGALDLLIDFDGEHPLTIADGPLDTCSTHGAGCSLSAAIAAFLALGHTLRDAAAEAKQFVAGAIRHAPTMGQGYGPIHHGWLIHPGPGPGSGL
ncbi:MAG TPA: bifunctional hydroxymethylpyrimidine kinase/phosphomethylpyrimidine kinase [Isosphaeraceae bacterium]|jgi:hydroxymethylpyrimidine/phosphomethylpyrimidine kinase|nr:bifunctional hydroxymethylpyrimidine kinase/phosphomethylpyrimidine kinase [Isosphaeraceae bacterium]